MHDALADGIQNNGSTFRPGYESMIAVARGLCNKIKGGDAAEVV